MMKDEENLKILSQLRDLMKEEQIDALIVPTDDPHMSEYTADYFSRRAFISGFTGSAGTAIVTLDQAFLFTDGRYHRQAEIELPTHWTLMKFGMKDVPTPTDFLSKTLTSGSVIGVDPFVHAVSAVKQQRTQWEKKGIAVKFLSHNLIDLVWGDQRPPKPSSLVRVQPLEYAGRSTADKLTDIRQKLQEQQVEAIVVSALDEIMWLYNIRGNDVSFNPVSICYAVVTSDAAHLFIDPDKIFSDVTSYCSENKITISPYEEIISFLEDFSATKQVWYDSNTLNMAVYNALHEDHRLEKVSPIILLKACKNDVELAGMKACHLRDGAAVVEFISWLEDYLAAGNTISEYDIDIKLTASRAAYELFLEPSFATIAGVNENGAIIHYRANQKDCKILTKNDILLLDSGGQYLDGTTDVTRTIHFGEPSERQCEMYTRVLKGYIGIDRQIFPIETPGCLLDSFAREHLWQIGMNYVHGTGHGVGASLNVHEGPHGISPRLLAQGLLPGMIVSNEPGYYEVGNFGIRIENLLSIEPKADFPEFNGKPFLHFEALTHIPIQTKMIRKELCTQQEIDWVNKYHQQVYERVLPLLKTERARQWLTTATARI